MPNEVLAVAKANGRHLRLVAQEPENTLKTAMTGATTEQKMQSLKKLVKTHPQYLSALQHLGRQLNDQRQYRAAPGLPDAGTGAGFPQPRTACEIARAYYLLNEDAKARQLLEETLTLNPCYHTGWQYLLVLLGRTKSPDGPRLAQPAHQANPANFNLALLGVKLYPPKPAVARMRELIDLYAPTFCSEELPAATAVFSQAIAQIVGPYLTEPECLALLQQACNAFPQSARLANLLARALFLVGDIAASYVHDRQAHALRQTALTRNAEFPTEDGSIHFGQFSEHIHSVLTKTTS